MKHIPLLLGLSLLLLSACSRGPAVSEEIKEKTKNPLYAKRYYEDLVEHMVNLEIQNDPLSESGATKDMIEDTRIAALSEAKSANAKRSSGLNGSLVSDFDYARGNVLLLDNVLFLGPEFSATPGIDLHVYVSSTIDPRDAAFPDPSAADLGSLKEAYGAQQYDVPKQTEGEPAFRTFVLFDRALNRVYGFAQLQTWN